MTRSLFTMTDSESSAPHGRELVRLVYWPRIVGSALCALCAATPLMVRASDAAGVAGAVLAAAVLLVWPHVAFFAAMRSRQPRRTEWINLWLESVFAGLLIAAIDVTPVPTAGLFMITSLGNVAVGGQRLMTWGWFGHAIGLGLGTWTWGWQPHWQSDLPSVLGTLPLMVVYPLMMGALLNRQADRIERSRRELRFLSEHDELSNVRNRRFFDQHAMKVFSQVQRHPRDLVLVMCDVDEFKQVNDRFGHGAGDNVIRNLGQVLAANARAGDVVARLGGDEFVALLADADTAHARRFAERVQQQLSLQLRAWPELEGLRLSFGVSRASPEQQNHQQWLDQADRALYQAKRQRNDELHFAEFQAGFSAEPS